MTQVVRSIAWGQNDASPAESRLAREWLVTNGLGGYASGTVAGPVTRRYHGLLVAALPAPLGRTLVLGHLSEQIRQSDGENVRIGEVARIDEPQTDPKPDYLVEFRLEAGLPIWRYRIGDIVLEKSLFLVHQQNTVRVRYRLLEGPEQVRLKLLPSVHFRPHDAPVSTPLPGDFHLHAAEGRCEISVGEALPTLRMQLHGGQPAFTFEPQMVKQVVYQVELSRGYDWVGEFWSPGYFRVDLSKEQDAHLVASTEAWEIVEALRQEEAVEAETERRGRLLAEALAPAQAGMGRDLVLAADQFVIRPTARREHDAAIEAAGDQVHSIIAGYHWFADWGRDTMISLEGLTLLTGRQAEAGCILRTFAHYIHDGLIPNLFPEGQRAGLYHTADATLWFFHALSRYLAYTHDHATLQVLLPRLHDILDHHLQGTRFGIGVDPEDGLLRQGAEGYQLTWMDAKVGDWVVTPRRGKAVEINALWYNALRLMEHWTAECEGIEAAKSFADSALRARESFNRRFWNASAGCLYDVVDGPEGDDPSCRPNQILALTLEYPVLDQGRWEPVLRTVERDLLTPVGLRSLAPHDPDFKPRYDGDLRARDAAYHQGTVWAWLIGPFVDAWLSVHPHDHCRAREFLRGFEAHLDEACIGSISEIFDANPPYTPRGCIAQAWSVAEVLRAWVKTAG